MNYIEREYISSSSHALCPKLNYVYASAYAAVIPSAVLMLHPLLSSLLVVPMHWPMQTSLGKHI